MHIKQVVIEGFKSYKEQTVAEPFSRKINVVVGANGSGKSNFFTAIRFVLNDGNQHMRQEDRQKLLHEGAGHAVISAYVELVFDNSDGRIPVDKEEVRLRRSIGLKKDEYQLNKKHVTKTEVMNLLESAGFSKANPYYVVQQGKIMSMSTMSDAERLALLKQVGGTSVYEERRSESLKILQETEARRSRINEVVGQLNEQLATLEAEQAELAKFQAADRQRRSIEFTIYDKDIALTRDKLAQVEADVKKEAESAGQAQEKLLEAKSQLKKLDKKLKGLTAEGAELSRAADSAEQAKRGLVTQHAQAQVDVSEAEEQLRSSSATQDSCAQELTELAAEIQQQEAQVQEAAAKLQAEEARSSANSAEVDDCQRRLQAIYEKQGRSAQYASEAARDEAVGREVKELQKSLKPKEKRLAQLQQQSREASANLAQLQQETSSQEAALRQAREAVRSCEKAQAALIVRRDQLQDEKKDLWRRQSEGATRLRELLDLKKAHEKKVEATMSWELKRGLEGMRRIVAQHKIAGVYGTLIELLDVRHQLYSAVEYLKKRKAAQIKQRRAGVKRQKKPPVTAGNALFHVVVDSAETATRICAQLQREKLGRITCMPLNTLQPPPIEYTKQWGTDALPLVHHIKWDSSLDSRLQLAFQQIFDKTMVCKDMEVASQVMKQAHIDCITIAGDQVLKSGKLCGGFLDTGRSRLDAAKRLKAVQQELEEVNAGQAVLQDSIAKAEQAMLKLLSDFQKGDARIDHLNDEAKRQEAALKGARQAEADARKHAEATSAHAADMQASIEQHEADITKLQAEVGTSLVAQLSASEQQDLASLNPRVRQLQDEGQPLKEALLEAQMAHTEAATRLTEDLLKRRERAQQLQAAADLPALQAALTKHRAEEASAAAALAEGQEAAAEAATAAKDNAQAVSELKTEMEQLREQFVAGDQSVQDEAKRREALMTKRTALTAKRADLEKAVRELGTLPADAFEKYREASLQQLHKLLGKAQAQLKQYGHVNKKALDQFQSFTDQRTDLVRRTQENDRSEEKIRELIGTLDLRKDEAIERTFKGVAANFRQIFAALVPGGRGELVMMKQARKRAREEPEEAAAQPDEDDSDAGEGHSVLEKYSGVAVKVRFQGSGETLVMKQLSGGQKTLVALALIFAIQRCDPAPFYLFDEIDAALDPAYRTTVANMIATQANDENSPAQFIITTFHPQLILKTDKVYGVSHANRVSRVDVVAREDALEFVQAAEEHQTTEQQDEE